MSHKPNQPDPTDAVLGGQSKPTVTDAVLGGLEGIKSRIVKGSEQAKIEALHQALNYGTKGLELIVQLVETETGIVQQAAYNLLWARADEQERQELLKCFPLDLVVGGDDNQLLNLLAAGQWKLTYKETMQVILKNIGTNHLVIYDSFDGSTEGTLVGSKLPVFTQGVFNEGIQTLRESSGSAVTYQGVTPSESGTISFWIKVISPIIFHSGINIGMYGREFGSCNDFFMQLQSDNGLNIAIHSGGGGTDFRDTFREPLLWTVGEKHHLVLAWGDGQKPVFYLDGKSHLLSGSPRGYVPRCPIGIPFLFAASRVDSGYTHLYSPGSFVFDDFIMLKRSLNEQEVIQLTTVGFHFINH